MMRKPIVLCALLLALATPALGQTVVGTDCTASWSAVTTNTDGTPVTGTITYNLFLSTTATPGTTPTLSGLTGTSAQPCSGLAAGTYNVWVQAVEQFSGSTSKSALSAPFASKLTIPGGTTVTVK